MELELEISRALGRDNINCTFRPPIPVRKSEGKGSIAFYGDGLVKTWDDLGEIRLPDPHDDRLYEPARRFLAESGDYARVAVSRIGISPTYLSMGTEAFWLALYDDPGLVDEVLRRYTEWSAAVVEHVIDLGFDVILMSDDIAFKTGPYVSPDVFRRLIVPRARVVTEKITIPWIYHSDGNLLELMDDLLDLGMSGIHPIEADAMDIAEFKRIYGARVCICGNINLTTLSIGTPDEVRAEVRERLRTVAPGGGYILGSGNSLTSYCKIENIRAMLETLRTFGTYPISA